MICPYKVLSEGAEVMRGTMVAENASEAAETIKKKPELFRLSDLTISVNGQVVHQQTNELINELKKRPICKKLQTRIQRPW